VGVSLILPPKKEGCSGRQDTVVKHRFNAKGAKIQWFNYFQHDGTGLIVNSGWNDLLSTPLKERTAALLFLPT
jgi:hypothetical protein